MTGEGFTEEEQREDEQRVLDTLRELGDSSFILRYKGQPLQTGDGAIRSHAYKVNSYDLEARTAQVTHIQSGETETVYFRDIRLIDQRVNGNI